MRMQAPPFAQAKLVRCARGAILDVAIDVRAGSPTFKAVVTAELTAEAGEQLLVPRGFLHGFITREPDTIVMYKVDNDYAPGSDRSVLWNDPALGIDWELDTPTPVLSRKDSDALSWDAFDTPFRYKAG